MSRRSLCFFASLRCLLTHQLYGRGPTGVKDHDCVLELGSLKEFDLILARGGNDGAWAICCHASGKLLCGPSASASGKLV